MHRVSTCSASAREAHASIHRAYPPKKASHCAGEKGGLVPIVPRHVESPRWVDDQWGSMIGRSTTAMPSACTARMAAAMDALVGEDALLKGAPEGQPPSTG